MLLQGGHFDRATNTVTASPYFSAVEFATQFAKLVGKENTIAMAKDDGAFVVATLCERAAESEELKATLKKWFSSKVQKELAVDKDRRGRSLLLAQLEKLS